MINPSTKQFFTENRPHYYDSAAFIAPSIETIKPPQIEEFRPLSADFPSLIQSSAYLKDSIKRHERNSKPNPNAASFVPGGFQPLSVPMPPPPKPISADAALLEEGLNLSQLELPQLRPSEYLESPFTGLSASDPGYILPESYFNSEVSLKLGFFQKFSLSTLFYLFYNMPGQQQQTLAAEDLYRREWQFHPATNTWYRIKKAERHHFNIQAWTLEKVVRVPENLLSKEEFRSQRGR